MYDYAMNNDLQIKFPVSKVISIEFESEFAYEKELMGRAKGLSIGVYLLVVFCIYEKIGKRKSENGKYRNVV